MLVFKLKCILDVYSYYLLQDFGYYWSVCFIAQFENWYNNPYFPICWQCWIIHGYIFPSFIISFNMLFGSCVFLLFNLPILLKVFGFVVIVSYHIQLLLLNTDMKFSFNILAFSLSEVISMLHFSRHLLSHSSLSRSRNLAQACCI